MAIVMRIEIKAMYVLFSINQGKILNIQEPTFLFAEAYSASATEIKNSGFVASSTFSLARETESSSCSTSSLSSSSPLCSKFLRFKIQRYITILSSQKTYKQANVSTENKVNEFMESLQ